MPQLGGDANFLEEPRGWAREAQLGAQRLDGHFAVALQVMREVHDGHAAPAEFLLQPVAICDFGGERTQVLGPNRARSSWETQPTLGRPLSGHKIRSDD